jgi:hypothetical protein
MATRWQLGVNRWPPHKIARREKDAFRGAIARLQKDGRKPDSQRKLQDAQAGNDNEPAMGGILQFRIVSQVQSVDDPTVTLKATDPDGRFRYQASLVPLSTT